LKLATSGGAPAVADYFTRYDEVGESAAAPDLGSGAAMLLPDLTDSAGIARYLMVGASKDGNLYVVNRDSMGRFSPGGNNVWQELTGVLGGGIWSTPAWSNGSPNGIVWAHENASPAVLHAFDAGNLAHELYNSSQAANGR